MESEGNDRGSRRDTVYVYSRPCTHNCDVRYTWPSTRAPRALSRFVHTRMHMHARVFALVSWTRGETGMNQCRFSRRRARPDCETKPSRGAERRLVREDGDGVLSAKIDLECSISRHASVPMQISIGCTGKWSHRLLSRARVIFFKRSGFFSFRYITVRVYYVSSRARLSHEK